MNLANTAFVFNLQKYCKNKHNINKFVRWKILWLLSKLGFRQLFLKKSDRFLSLYWNFNLITIQNILCEINIRINNLGAHFNKIELSKCWFWKRSNHLVTLNVQILLIFSITTIWLAMENLRKICSSPWSTKFLFHRYEFAKSLTISKKNSG